jgi:hypothetical protein
MNIKLIHQIMNQAGTDVSGKWMGISQAEKFAELIVRECMSNLYQNGYDNAMIHIQKHFEVEE